MPKPSAIEIGKSETMKAIFNKIENAPLAAVDLSKYPNLEVSPLAPAEVATREVGRDVISVWRWGDEVIMDRYVEGMLGNKIDVYRFVSLEEALYAANNLDGSDGGWAVIAEFKEIDQ